MIPEANPPKKSATLFLPEHQRNAANELHQMLNDRMAPFLGREISTRLIEEMAGAVEEAVVAWNQKYPILSKHNIGFELKTENNKITIVPSYDFQRLLAGQIV